MSELRRLPQEDVQKVFKDPYDQKMIKTILSKVMENFEDLHDKIEVELDALNHALREQS
jgi:arsenate reductase-like glutaredoxin family protein